MVYDFLATSDVPSANYNTGTGALFGSPSETRGRFRAPPTALGGYNFTLYCNEAADIVFMWAGNTGQNGTGYAWGKLFTADNGTTPECYCAMGFATVTAYMGVTPCMQSYASSYSNNLAGTQNLWVYDPAANEGATTAVHVVLNANQLSGSAMPYGGQSSYTAGEATYKLPNGVRRFYPLLGAVQHNNAMARPSFLAMQSRYWGYGPCAVLDAVWTDNNAVVQGYYLGTHNVAANEGTMMSLLNSTF
jgi:hypothetical protein